MESISGRNHVIGPKSKFGEFKSPKNQINLDSDDKDTDQEGRLCNVSNYINVEAASSQHASADKLDNNTDLAIIDTSKFFKNTTSRSGRGDMSPIEGTRKAMPPDAGNNHSMKLIQKGVPPDQGIPKEAGLDGPYYEGVPADRAAMATSHLKIREQQITLGNDTQLKSDHAMLANLMNSSDISPNGPTPEKVFKIEGSKKDKQKLSVNRIKADGRTVHPMEQVFAGESYEQSVVAVTDQKALELDRVEEQTHREIFDI